MQFWDAAQQVISIHAPREGGDVIISMALRKKVYFNPRPPRGGRQLDVGGQLIHADFNPRPPARGATW